jgi:hypothetical protein
MHNEALLITWLEYEGDFMLTFESFVIKKGR